MPKKWTLREITRAYEVISALKHSQLLAPMPGALADLDMKGLSFPTVSLCEKLNVADNIVKAVVGRQEFSDATIRHVDFSEADLNYSVWNNCVFNDVKFVEASLEDVRFFGCEFTNCVFMSTSLRSASLSTGRKGVSTTLVNCVIERSDLQGLTTQSLVAKNTNFKLSKMDGIVFNSPIFDTVGIEGEFSEISLYGDSPSAPAGRLTPEIDLAKSQVKWLLADGGIDLSRVSLKRDKKSLIFGQRIKAIDIICKELSGLSKGRYGEVARLLKGLYSNNSISPLHASQDDVYLSNGVIAELDESLSEYETGEILSIIYDIAKAHEVLIAPCY